MADALWYRWDGRDLLLQLRVQPRSSRDELAEIQGACRRVRITAPPVNGKANSHLCSFLAKIFQVPRSHVTLCSGEISRDKRLRISAPRHLPPEIDPPPP